VDFKEILISVALFVGTAAAALIVGLRSKVAKSVQDITSQVQGVIVPLTTISSNVDTLLSDVKVIKNDLSTVKDDQKETKLEVRKAVNDRTEILTRLSRIEGIEQGREDREREKKPGGRR
jgi:uncharacterized protein YoxC